MKNVSWHLCTNNKISDFNPDPHHPRDCGIYYSCRPAPNYPDHWLITLCHCDQGLAYDPDIEVCTWPDSVDDCPNRSKFYIWHQTYSSIKSPDECIAKVQFKYIG